MAGIIPHDADWVWFLGDDDIYVDDNAIVDVINVILNNNVDYIHVSQSGDLIKLFN